MKKRQAPVSFTKLFCAKRALDQAEAALGKAQKEYLDILRQAQHLSGRIATHNKHKYYVTIVKNSMWAPELKLQKVNE
jgi:hypothetical protein